MTTPRQRQCLYGLLSAPMALLMAMPAGALNRPPPPKPELALSLLAQGGANTAASVILPEITALEEKARSLYQRGESHKALEEIQRVMAWVNANLPKTHPYRARSQAWIGLLLSAVGRRQEALAPTEEALKIYRGLAQSNPAFQGDLANALINLAVRYSELGRRQEALAPAEEALKIYRGLAQSNPAFQVDLANALNNLGSFYGEVGRRQEARVAAEEAAKLYREIVKRNPVELARFANSLDNLADKSFAVGRTQETLYLSQEAISLSRGLAQVNPVELSTLAIILNNHAYRLSRQGRYKEALGQSEEAVKIFEILAKSKDKDHELLPYSLDTLGTIYWGLNRKKEALAVANRSVSLFRQLSAENPGFYQHLLAYSLTSLGVIQQAVAQPEQARASYEEAAAIYRPLAAANPAFKEDLQRTLNNLENLIREESKRTGAVKEVNKADLSYLPRADSINPVKRAVVRLYPTYGGKNSGVGPYVGTGFVVKRQGDRAWIVTARHVVFEPKENSIPIKLEAELYAGSLPNGLGPPRLEVELPSQIAAWQGSEDLIVLVIRGLPADVQPLPLSTAPPQGVLKVVGHYPKDVPWNVLAVEFLDALTEPSSRELKLAGLMDMGASGSPVLNSAGQVVGMVLTVTDVANPNKMVISAYRALVLTEKIR
jgi:tetratricopeptide (TPR) repeat protein